MNRRGLLSGQDLVLIRQAHGWTRRDLARILGLDPAHIWRIEHGERAFTRRVMRHLQLYVAYTELLEVAETIQGQNEILARKLSLA